MEICKKCSSYDPDGKLARRTWVRVIASDYTYDAAGRRTAITKTGCAFGDLSGSVDSYSYNARSELTSAHRTKNGQPTPGFSEDFDYDPIGNRRSSATYNEKGEAQTSTYEANNLNQYTTRTTPGYAAVRGEADPDATVTVNENPTFRLGSYYFGSDNFDNISAGGFANLETYATLAQTAASGEEAEDLVSAETNQVYIAQSPETFAYDDDGNQTLITTKTGLWRVTYNGENRPILWVRDSDNLTLAMAYDHIGRRREKNERQFFYDGYLQVADNAGDAYTWDCTETVATRPLAWCRDNFFGCYAHDGNKNVSEIMAADGIMAAHYENSPFGVVAISRGSFASTNPWRFSSEYAEDDTATVYYNYRHYEPVTGRWPQRDDVDELTLYLLCSNSAIGSFDLLGYRSYSYEFNLEQNQLGYSFYGRVSVSESDCPKEIEAEVLMGVEWQPPQLRAANLVLNSFRIHIDGGVRGLIGGKARFSECSGKSTSKICGRLEVFARAEYRDWKVQEMGRRHRFTRSRFGIGADGGGTACIDLITGDLTVQASFNYYAYANFGWKWFNRTYDFGGSYETKERKIATFDSMKLLPPIREDGDFGCCCEKKYGKKQ